ncbi:MAG: helix-turn-helix transcriptional regulator [Bacteroidaceae bacterium]|nr:helix-turn-helix transcriptional regulator [Bacteroidaceae bacterium]
MHHPTVSPEIAIIDPNTFCCLGLKSLLESIIPQVVVRSFNCFQQLMDDTPDTYVHYFVTSAIVMEHNLFFQERRQKTIVLTSGNNNLSGRFHTLDATLPEKELVRTLLCLHQGAHGHSHQMSVKQYSRKSEPQLSPREIEVLVLLVQGLINKQIADRLNISLTTVISHRKNIIEKLGIRSLSGLTVYAVMNGLVEANQI